LIKNEFKPENYDLPLNKILENDNYKQQLAPILQRYRDTYTIFGRVDDPSFQVTTQ